MRHHTLLLALSATVGLGLPALAADGSEPVNLGKDVILHNLTPSGPIQVAHGQDGHHDDDCCDPQGQGKQGHEDCDDSCCDGQCDSDHHDGHGDHHGGSGGDRQGGMRTMGHGGMARWMAGAQADFGIKQQWNVPNGRAYTMVGWDHLFGRPVNNMWWNPKMGCTGSYGMDLADQTNTRHLAMGGWLGQNTFRFGPVNVNLGVALGGGLNLDVTPTLGFQNYNGFFLADPRLSIGWQVTRRMSVNLNGNYLFTTRPAAIGGPGAGLSLNYGF